MFYKHFFHYSNLDEVVGERLSFRASEFFKDVYDVFPKFARIVYPWDATEFTPNSTGIPSHVMLMSEIEGPRLKFDALG